MKRAQSGDEAEQKKHRQSVEDLSAALRLPWESVITVYEQELTLMTRMARIRDYLPSLVSRRVKNMLRR